MFAAVPLPDDVVADLEEFLEPRRESAPFRWTRPETWHVTLAFMAAVPDRSVDDLVERLTRAARRRARVVLRIEGGGAFPNPGRAKVLYAAVAGGAEAVEELRRLSVGARAAAGKAGAPAAGGPFRAHVTLARINKPVEATRWVRVLGTYRSRDFELAELVLVESHLGQGPGGRPRYDVVHRCPVGAG
jgi:2'-5' RNA ligase